MQIKARKINRIIALVTALLFTGQTVLWSAPALSFNAAADSAAILFGSTEQMVRELDIPDSIGRIDTRYVAQDTNAPVLIHIQDAHALPEAQRHIQTILEYLTRANYVDRIAVESAFGQIDPTLLRIFDDEELNQAFAQTLLEMGELTGVELFAVNHPEFAANIQGAEDSLLYKESFELFREIKQAESEWREVLSGYEKFIEQLQLKVFRGQLRDYALKQAEWKDSRDHSIEYLHLIGEYAREYLELDLQDPRNQFNWPSTVRLFTISRLEESLDPEKSRRQAEEIMRALDTLEDADLAQYFKTVIRKFYLEEGQHDFSEFSDSDHPYVESARTFFEYFRRGVKNKIELLGYPHFLQSAGILILRNELDAVQLFDELDRLERGVERKLVQTKGENELLQLREGVRLIDKLLTLKMSRENFESYKSNKANLLSGKLSERLGRFHRLIPSTKDLPEISQSLLDKAERFYKLSVERDRALFDNTLKLMQSERGDDVRAAVLITGGFHTRGLTESLKEREISHIVVSPKISRITEDGLYENAMLGKNIPEELAGPAASSIGKILALQSAAAYEQGPLSEADRQLVFLSALRTFVRESLSNYNTDQLHRLLSAAFSSSDVFSGLRLERDASSLAVVIGADDAVQKFYLVGETEEAETSAVITLPPVSVAREETPAQNAAANPLQRFKSVFSAALGGVSGAISSVRQEGRSELRQLEEIKEYLDQITDESGNPLMGSERTRIESSVERLMAQKNNFVENMGQDLMGVHSELTDGSRLELNIESIASQIYNERQIKNLPLAYRAVFGLAVLDHDNFPGIYDRLKALLDTIDFASYKTSDRIDAETYYKVSRMLSLAEDDFTTDEFMVFQFVVNKMIFDLPRIERRALEMEYKIQQFIQELNEPGSGDIFSYAFITDYHGSEKIGKLVGHGLGVRDYESITDLASLVAKLTEEGIDIDEISRRMTYVGGSDYVDRGPKPVWGLRVNQWLRQHHMMKFILGNHELWKDGNIIGLHFRVHDAFREILDLHRKDPKPLEEYVNLIRPFVTTYGWDDQEDAEKFSILENTLSEIISDFINASQGVSETDIEKAIDAAANKIIDSGTNPNHSLEWWSREWFVHDGWADKFLDQLNEEMINEVVDHLNRQIRESSQMRDAVIRVLDEAEELRQSILEGRDWEAVKAGLAESGELWESITAAAFENEQVNVEKKRNQIKSKTLNAPIRLLNESIGRLKVTPDGDELNELKAKTLEELRELLSVYRGVNRDLFESSIHTEFDEKEALILKMITALEDETDSADFRAQLEIIEQHNVETTFAYTAINAARVLNDLLLEVGELNRLLNFSEVLEAPSAEEVDLVTPQNYRSNSVVVDSALWDYKNLRLIYIDAYGNAYLHGIIPINQDGFDINYKTSYGTVLHGPAAVERMQYDIRRFFEMIEAEAKAELIAEGVDVNTVDFADQLNKRVGLNMDTADFRQRHEEAIGDAQRELFRWYSDKTALLKPGDIQKFLAKGGPKAEEYNWSYRSAYRPREFKGNFGILFQGHTDVSKRQSKKIPDWMGGMFGGVWHGDDDMSSGYLDLGSYGVIASFVDGKITGIRRNGYKESVKWFKKREQGLRDELQKVMAEVNEELAGEEGTPRTQMFENLQTEIETVLLHLDRINTSPAKIEDTTMQSVPEEEREGAAEAMSAVGFMRTYGEQFLIDLKDSYETLVRESPNFGIPDARIAVYESKLRELDDMAAAFRAALDQAESDDEDDLEENAPLSELRSEEEFSLNDVEPTFAVFRNLKQIYANFTQGFGFRVHAAAHSKLSQINELSFKAVRPYSRRVLDVRQSDPGIDPALKERLDKLAQNTDSLEKFRRYRNEVFGTLTTTSRWHFTTAGDFINRFEELVNSFSSFESIDLPVREAAKTHWQQMKARYEAANAKDAAAGTQQVQYINAFFREMEAIWPAGTQMTLENADSMNQFINWMHTTVEESVFKLNAVNQDQILDLDFYLTGKHAPIFNLLKGARIDGNILIRGNSLWVVKKEGMHHTEVYANLAPPELGGVVEFTYHEVGYNTEHAMRLAMVDTAFREMGFEVETYSVDGYLGGENGRRFRMGRQAKNVDELVSKLRYGLDATATVPINARALGEAFQGHTRWVRNDEGRYVEDRHYYHPEKRDRTERIKNAIIQGWAHKLAVTGGSTGFDGHEIAGRYLIDVRGQDDEVVVPFAVFADGAEGLEVELATFSSNIPYETVSIWNGEGDYADLGLQALKRTERKIHRALQDTLRALKLPKMPPFETGILSQSFIDEHFNDVIARALNKGQLLEEGGELKINPDFKSVDAVTRFLDSWTEGEESRRQMVQVGAYLDDVLLKYEAIGEIGDTQIQSSELAFIDGHIKIVIARRNTDGAAIAALVTGSRPAGDTEDGVSKTERYVLTVEDLQRKFLENNVSAKEIPLFSEDILQSYIKQNQETLTAPSSNSLSVGTPLSAEALLPGSATGTITYDDTRESYDNEILVVERVTEEIVRRFIADDGLLGIISLEGNRNSHVNTSAKAAGKPRLNILGAIQSPDTGRWVAPAPRLSGVAGFDGYEAQYVRPDDPESRKWIQLEEGDVVVMNGTAGTVTWIGQNDDVQDILDTLNQYWQAEEDVATDSEKQQAALRLFNVFEQKRDAGIYEAVQFGLQELFFSGRRVMINDLFMRMRSLALVNGDDGEQLTDAEQTHKKEISDIFIKLFDFARYQTIAAFDRQADEILVAKRVDHVYDALEQLEKQYRHYNALYEAVSDILPAVDNASVTADLDNQMIRLTRLVRQQFDVLRNELQQKILEISAEYSDIDSVGLDRFFIFRRTLERIIEFERIFGVDTAFPDERVRQAVQHIRNIHAKLFEERRKHISDLKVQNDLVPLRITDVGYGEIIGNKAANIGWLFQFLGWYKEQGYQGFDIAPGYGVPNQFYQDFLDEEVFLTSFQGQRLHSAVSQTVNRNISAAERSSLIRGAFSKTDFPVAVHARLSQLDLDSAELEVATGVAVRSSTSIEDSPDQTAAGLFQSNLGANNMGALKRHLLNTWASFFSERAIQYKEVLYGKGNIDAREVQGAIIQDLIEADAAGVITSADLGSEDRGKIVINAGAGLGISVVDATQDADLIIVDKVTGNTDKTRSRQGKKLEKIVYDPDRASVKTVPTTEDERDGYILSPIIISRLKDFMLAAEEWYGYVVQVEFAVKDDVIYLKQIRPMPGFKVLQSERIYLDRIFSVTAPRATRPHSAFDDLDFTDRYEQRSDSVRRSEDRVALLNELKASDDVSVWHDLLNRLHLDDEQQSEEFVVQLSRGIEMRFQAARDVLEDNDLLNALHRYLAARIFYAGINYGTDFVAFGVTGPVNSFNQLVNFAEIESILTDGVFAQVHDKLDADGMSQISLRNLGNAGRPISFISLDEVGAVTERLALQTPHQPDTGYPGIYIGNDTGGGSSKLGVWQNGEQLVLPEELSSFSTTTENFESGVDYTHRMAAHIKAIQEFVGQPIDGVGIDIPGAADLRNNRMVTLGQIPNEKKWSEQDFQDALNLQNVIAAALGLPDHRVIIRNDMDGVLTGAASLIRKVKPDFFADTEGSFRFDWMGTGHGHQYAVKGSPLAAPTEGGHAVVHFGADNQAVFDTEAFTSIPGMIQTAIANGFPENLTVNDEGKKVFVHIGNSAAGIDHVEHQEAALTAFRQFAKSYAQNLILGFITAEQTGVGNASEVLLGGGVTLGQSGDLFKRLTLEELQRRGYGDRIRIQVLTEDEIKSAMNNPADIGALGSAILIQNNLRDQRSATISISAVDTLWGRPLVIRGEPVAVEELNIRVFFQQEGVLQRLLMQTGDMSRVDEIEIITTGQAIDNALVIQDSTMIITVPLAYYSSDGLEILKSALSGEVKRSDLEINIIEQLRVLRREIDESDVVGVLQSFLRRDYDSAKAQVDAIKLGLDPEFAASALGQEDTLYDLYSRLEIVSENLQTLIDRSEQRTYSYDPSRRIPSKDAVLAFELANRYREMFASDISEEFSDQLVANIENDDLRLAKVAVVNALRAFTPLRSLRQLEILNNYLARALHVTARSEHRDDWQAPVNPERIAERLAAGESVEVYKPVSVQLYDDGDAFGKVAAQKIIDTVRQYPDAVIILPTGSTPGGMYAALVKAFADDPSIDFSQVRFFNLDEYLDLEEGHPLSYQFFMQKKLYEKLDAIDPSRAPKPENRNIPSVTHMARFAGYDAAIETEEYDVLRAAYENRLQQVIQSTGRKAADLAFLGAGGAYPIEDVVNGGFLKDENGEHILHGFHIGFNEPGAVVNSRVSIIPLTPKTRKDTGFRFGNVTSRPDYKEQWQTAVPFRAISMGVANILESHEIVLMANSEEKSIVLERAYDKPAPDPNFPGSYLMYHPNVNWLLDHDAASRLPHTLRPWTVVPEGTFEWTQRTRFQAITEALKEFPDLRISDLAAEHLNAVGISDLEIQNRFGSIPQIAQEFLEALDDRIVTRNDGLLPRGKNIDIVSPHPDDDVITSAVTMRTLVALGNNVRVIYMVGGENAVRVEDAQTILAYQEAEERLRADIGDRELSELEKASLWSQAKLKVRRAEAESATAVTDVTDTEFLNLPYYKTRGFEDLPALDPVKDVKVFERLIAERKTDFILYSAEKDPHGAHGLAAKTAAQALVNLGPDFYNKVTVWGYRGAYEEWKLYDVENLIVVPYGRQVMDQVKVVAILKHFSQINPLFPSFDPREFWERTFDRNSVTGQLLYQLGFLDDTAILQQELADILTLRPQDGVVRPLQPGELTDMALKELAKLQEKVGTYFAEVFKEFTARDFITGQLGASALEARPERQESRSLEPGTAEWFDAKHAFVRSATELPSSQVSYDYFMDDALQLLSGLDAQAHGFGSDDTLKKILSALLDGRLHEPSPAELEAMEIALSAGKERFDVGELQPGIFYETLGESGDDYGPAYAVISKAVANEDSEYFIRIGVETALSEVPLEFVSLVMSQSAKDYLIGKLQQAVDAGLLSNEEFMSRASRLFSYYELVQTIDNTADGQTRIIGEAPRHELRMNSIFDGFPASAEAISEELGMSDREFADLYLSPRAAAQPGFSYFAVQLIDVIESEEFPRNVNVPLIFERLSLLVKQIPAYRFEDPYDREIVLNDVRNLNARIQEYFADKDQDFIDISASLDFLAELRLRDTVKELMEPFNVNIDDSDFVLSGEHDRVVRYLADNYVLIDDYVDVDEALAEDVTESFNQDGLRMTSTLTRDLLAKVVFRLRAELRAQAADSLTSFSSDLNPDSLQAQTVADLTETYRRIKPYMGDYENRRWVTIHVTGGVTAVLPADIAEMIQRDIKRYWQHDVAYFDAHVREDVDENFAGLEIAIVDARTLADEQTRMEHFFGIGLTLQQHPNSRIHQFVISDQAEDVDVWKQSFRDEMAQTDFASRYELEVVSESQLAKRMGEVMAKAFSLMQSDLGRMTLPQFVKSHVSFSSSDRGVLSGVEQNIGWLILDDLPRHAGVQVLRQNNALNLASAKNAELVRKLGEIAKVNKVISAMNDLISEGEFNAAVRLWQEMVQKRFIHQSA